VSTDEHRIEHPCPGAEIRYYGDTLDEVIAEGASVHLEAMDTGRWWLGITVGSTRISVDLGVINLKAKTYAHATVEEWE